LSELKALPKPNVGNTIEATRLNKLGIEELKDQNYEHAAFQFDAAVKADPSEAKYLSNLGYAETYDGDLDSAWKHLCLSIQLDPSRSVAWGDLGILLAKQGSQEKSVSAFLIGDKVVEGGTRDFLEHLVSNKANDATVREASASALERLKKTNSTGLAGH
jgi:tetratricopeptide (TPR) repeat protein